MAKQQYLDLTGLTTYNNEIQTQLDGKSNTNHTHNYAGSSSAGGAATSANKVNSSLTVQLNGGTTEGTNKFTFNGSAAKSVNITPSGIGASASSHTHDDRYYTESEIDTKLSGKAPSSHNHSASNITSGTLAVERGGTGNTDGYIRTGALSGTTVGTLATAEGRNVTASGSYCHAEGNYTEASGSSAHAEGQSSTASGIASHAEGNNATASGNYSHAEGDFTSASAKGAHVEGTYTLASSEYQHVQGKFNVEDKAGTYAHIVGNGESTSARSNAHTLDWDGNAWFAGDVYVGGTDQSTGSKVLTGDHTHSQLNGSTTYGSGIEVADYNSSVSYLKPLRNSGGVNLGFDDYRFGNLYLTDTIYIGDNGSGTTTSSNDVRINSMGVYVGGTNLENNLVNASTAYGDVTLLASAFRPTITNKLSCGGSSYIWTQVYANKTTITSSDRRIKRDIKDLDDRYIQLFDLIEPKSYYLVDGDRIHTGFISQDVEEVMKHVGLTAEELAFFCKHVKTEAIYDENGNWVEDKEVLDENGNPIYIYALRYEEYIAIMAEKIKRLEAKYNSKLEELDEKLVKVDEKLAQLDSKLNK